MMGRRDAYLLNSFFFFQAEDGIRDVAVTGVQTCALPICQRIGPEGYVCAMALLKSPSSNGLRANIRPRTHLIVSSRLVSILQISGSTATQIGRASCRERV